MNWENNVRKVIPYVPGEQPGQANIIKLNTNECPYPPSPSVKEALVQLEAADLRLYPDPQAGSLSKVLAQYYGVGEDMVFTGVGSDDVLALSFLTYFNGEAPVLFPDITYSFYQVWADLYRIPYRKQALDDRLGIRMEDYLVHNGGIIFPNPNAPTGVLESTETIESIIRSNPDVVVIIDEAYIDFGGESVLPLVKKYDNLLVVQTFSKSRALAGMRIGFAIGCPRLISCLKDVKFSFNSYTMSRAAMACGTASVKDEAYFKATVRKVVDTRERVKPAMKKLGFLFEDSYANFIFAKHPGHRAKDIQEALRKQNIYVRHFESERVNDYLRITIGTDEEMDILLEYLREYLNL